MAATSVLSKTAVLRLAGPKDVGNILALIRELAEFENLLQECVATEESLQKSVFVSPPFQGPTVILLEVDATEVTDSAPSGANEELHLLPSMEPVMDSAAQQYASTAHPSRTVVGFVLVFPNYSTFLAKAGLYVEDLYIREPYRRLGFGRLLLSFVLRHGAKQGFGRVEWCVLDWNVKAINFYKSMGATVMDEWRVCRVTGDALAAYNKQ